ncbi:MAG: hypothetical protein FWD23_15465 [Oscillospiraceae bacterium]|nr:hypothetical protein [Oscillospiraceae bacterium]
MKVKKIFFIAALFIFTATVFISCEKSDGTAATDTGAASQTSESPFDGEDPQRAVPDLPDTDFGGAVYKVLGRYSESFPQFHNFDIDAESITGDPVNDAVYDRNRKLEAKYNVVICQILQDDPAAALQKLIKADEDEYSLAFIAQDKVGAMATLGSFCDLYRLKYVDFAKPWWNRQVNDAVSVRGRLYYTTSDFNMMDKNRTYLLMYNKEMAQSFSLGNFYDLVYENKWTVDKMTELCKAVAGDTDGDGVMTEEDRWGLVMDSYNSFYTFFAACGNYMFTKDADDCPELSLKNERAVSTVDKILNLANNKMTSFYAEDFVGISANPYSIPGNVFRSGRALFTSSFTHTLQFTTRESDVDFGVLPFPKYDENQKDYIGVPDSFYSPLFAVPVTVQNADFAAFMLEALSAASKYDVLPYFYETATKTKYTKDEDSPKMLDIIFNGIRRDLGIIYNWSDVSHLFRVNIPMGGVNNLVSAYEAIEDKVMAAMEKTVNIFAELN